MQLTLATATIAARAGFGLLSTLVMAAPAGAQPADPRQSRGIEVINQLSTAPVSRCWRSCAATFRPLAMPF